MNSQKPLVSILLPTYNDASHIVKSLESVLSQSYENWELIIIDDASTDNSNELINKTIENNSKVKYILNKENQGIVKSLNIGLKSANGSLIARIDGDDIWNDKNKLSKQVQFLIKNKNHILVGTFAQRIDESGKIIDNLTYPTDDDEIRKYILIENCFVHSSVLFRKKAAMELGAYSEDLKFAEDYDLWLRMGKIGKIANIPLSMVQYRYSNEGISQKNKKQQIQNSITIVLKYKSEYPKAWIGIFLWNLRLLIPKTVSTKLSNFYRRVIRGYK